MTITEVERFYRILDREFYVTIIAPKVAYDDNQIFGGGSQNDRGMNVVDRKINLYNNIQKYHHTGNRYFLEDAISDCYWFMDKFPYLRFKGNTVRKKRQT